MDGSHLNHGLLWPLNESAVALNGFIDGLSFNVVLA